MRKIMRTTLIAALLFLMTPIAEAAVTPLSVGIVPPVQFPPSDFTITGVRVSALWGRHRDVYGIDFGALGNITEQDFFGLGVSGLANYTKGTTTALGVQLAGLANINENKTNVYGVQAALAANVNSAESSVNGLQVALVNMSSHTKIRGLQAGMYNTAKVVYGVQFGLVNVTDSLYGIQIGLLNFNHQGIFKVSPVINIGF